MIAITTSNSIRVKAGDRSGEFCIAAGLCRAERLFTIISLPNECFSVDGTLCGKISKVFTSVVLLYYRINVANSLPFLNLLRERTLRAIGIVLHAKVLVNLKQALLVRDRF